MIDFDFHLLDVSVELDALEDFLQLIEKQMDRIQRTERLRLDTRITQEKLSPDDPEWHSAMDEFDHRVEFFLPRFFRGPFLVTLYAVYESAVIEIARLIQKRKLHHESIDDQRGAFLKRAKKYYKHILHFDLYKSDDEWEKMMMLSDLRNAIAHANGRIEMLKPGSKTNIDKWERQESGISNWHGSLVFDAKFVRNIFEVVHRSLHNLIERYKDFDHGE